MRTFAVAALVACSPSHGGEHDAMPPDSGEVSSGTHLVDHAAFVGAITSDNYVAYYDLNADNHTVAEAIPLAGGAAASIATSTGSGKVDIKLETIGPLALASTDRGNKMSTLTMWSAASGVIPIGPDVRPDRAGGLADGTAVIYESGVGSSSANVVAGSPSAAQLVGSANSADNDCWQDTDLAAAGNRLVARYCPGTSTAFSLVSVAADGGSAATLSTDATGAYYGSSSIVWIESSGALYVAAPDGTSPRTLGSDATELTVSPDGTTIAWLTTGGAIELAALAGSGSATQVVAAGIAKQLGALSPDDQTVLFASQVVDMGSAFVQPFTDVLAARAGNAPLVLEPNATSCVGCMSNSFTADGKYALAIDPIDNSQQADGVGPVRAFSTDNGASVATFGSNAYGAIAVGDSTIVLFEATKNSALETGFAYGLTLQDATASATGTVIARDAESFVFDDALMNAIVSFPGSDATAGIWVTPIR